jgi:hypothetical protein
MGECTHPRGQHYTDDENRARCGACGDVWDDNLGQFRPLMMGDLMAVAASTPRVVVVDVRNGKVRADGANIDLPLEGQHSFLRSLETADVIVEVHEDTVLVTKGYDKRIVLLGQTKTVVAMNNEKAERDKDNRTNYLYDDLKAGEHPVEVKMRRVWDKDDPGYVESGEPEERGLKGF